MIYFSLGGSGGQAPAETRVYEGQMIARVSAASENITSSSKDQYSGGNWKAFDGIDSSDLRSPGNAWTPKVNDSTPWIQYNFNTLKYFEKIVLKVFSNYGDAWVGNIQILGSIDNTNWENLLKTGTEIEIEAPLQSFAEIEIPLNQTKLYQYIRVQGTSAFCTYYAPTLWIDEIYVYGGHEKVESDLTTKLFTYSNNSISSKLIFTSALPLNETITLSMLEFKNLPSNISLTGITRDTDNSFSIPYTIASGTFTPPTPLEATISKNLFDKDYFSQDIDENSTLNNVRIELVVPQGTALGLSKTKANDEWAVGVWCDNLNGGGLGYYGPVLIGLTQTAVDYNDGFYLTQVEYGGVTYYANSNHWIDGRLAKPEGCELIYSTSDLFNDGRITSGYILADVVTAALDYYFGF